MICAPVVLFTYKRLQSTQMVVDALLKNPEAAASELIVYSDGPKGAADVLEVGAVRDYLRSIGGFKSVELIFRDRNYGLAESFISGIGEVFERHEQAIFVEDDNLVSSGFLKFMNGALNHYRECAEVGCISGYSFPLWPKQSSYYFVRGAETWSMATWRRSWRCFCSDGASLLSELKRKNLEFQFKLDGFGFYPMLQQQVRGEIDSWGVRWWTSAYINKLHCLYPPQPLCVSIGYGEDSVHCKEPSPMFRNSSDLVSHASSFSFPKEVKETLRTKVSIVFMNRFYLRYVYRFKRLFGNYLK